jgi:MFS family permease
VSGGLWSPERRALSAGLVLTVTLVAAESLAVGTVMPLVARELGGLELYGWVFSAFFLATLVGIVTAGGLVDRGSGLAGPLALGLGCFAVGLVLAGLAPSMPLLVVARAIQGFGAGFEPPIAYVAIGRALPDDLRPRMFAVLSTAWVIPGVIGPAIAGFVADVAGWRWIFLGILPLVALATAITLPALAAEDRGPHGRPASVAAPADVGATALAAPGPRSVPRDSLRVRVPLALAIAAGAATALAGLGALDDAPLPGIALLVGGLAIGVPAFRRLTPAGTLRARPVLPAAVLLRGLLTFTFFAADAYVPLALVEVRGTSAAAAGLALTAATLAWTAGAWAQARRVQRLGAAAFVATGFAVVLGGLAVTAAVLIDSVPIVVGVLGWGLAGLGMGLAYAPLSLVVLREARPGEEGFATSGLQLSDVVGTALGTGTGGAAVALLAGAATGGGVDPERMAVAVAAAFGAGAVAGVVGLSLAGRLRRRPAVPGPSVTGQAGAALR